ncbi:MAG: diaminobutyrate--2-oxoglutarate transaminase [Thiolinea sp.]
MESTPSVYKQYESSVRGYCRRFNPVFTHASGSILTDSAGRHYLDFLAACGALNYGHNDPDMSAALIQHIRNQGLSAALDLHSLPKTRFLEAFRDLILRPRGLEYRLQFTGPTGTNAVEAAIKLARRVTGRHNIVAFTNGFHGVTLGALAATGNKYNRMGLPLPGVFRAPYEHYAGAGFDSAAYLEQLLNDPSSGVEAPAAILLETVQGEGGLNTVSPAWIQAIAALAKRQGALLIVDDVQAGCGRTGSFFSFEPLGIEPDLVVLSKSLSGYGLPMALVLIRPEHDSWQPGEHNGTFRGNTHAFVTARVALEKYWSDSAFAQQIQAKGQQVAAGLERIAALLPGARLKGRGMMRGIDVGSGERADQICRAAFSTGLIIETSGPHDEVIKVLAPLTTPDAQLAQGLEQLEQAAASVMAHTAPRRVA